MLINQEKIQAIQNSVSPEYLEIITNMNQTHLQIIIGLLSKQISFDVINKATGYSLDIIKQIQRRYLPEQVLATMQSQESIGEVLQLINKGKSRLSLTLSKTGKVLN